MIHTAADFRAYAAEHELLYVQELLPIDRDLRIVVVGREVVTAYWRIAAEGQFHNNVAAGGTLSFDDIPDSAVSFVRALANDLDIDHAGFDLALVDGFPYLFEFNMRFGNMGLRQQNIKLGELIYQYLQSKTIDNS